MENEVSVITVLLSGPNVGKANLESMAQRIHEALNGNSLERIDGEGPHDEGRRCDGINIMDRICIGRSR